ncbi:DUF1015 domain-containing protein [bacterium]|nr:DUF1015 domain-containing protein [bacterium]MBU1598774.1 DUF1015 domain-containing protein [bacterium]
MAKIHPFRGIFYNQEKVEIPSVVAPPYDIISCVEQEAFYQANQYNIIRLILGKGYLNDTEENNRYTRAKEFKTNWKKEGVLIEEETPSFYLYQQEWALDGKEGVMSGIIASIEAEPYSVKTVLPHERTLSEPKKDQLELLKATQMNFCPIFLVYCDEEKKVKRWLTPSGPPKIQFEYEKGLCCRLWQIKENIEEISAIFEKKQLFIADGHHRYETTLAFAREKRGNRVMAMLLEKDAGGFIILSAHRLLKNTLKEERLQGFLVEKVKKEELVSILSERKGVGIFGMVKLEGAYILTLKNGEELDLAEPLKKVDVAILHNVIFDGLEEEKDVTYTKNAQEVFSRVSSGEFACGFLLRPTSFESVMDVALASLYMPGKATYFFPKPFSGVVMHSV